MIKINGKYIRNIPEQVGKNKRDIFQLDTDLSALEVKVNAALAGVFHYKGSVATYGDLPSSDNEVGDVYNVIDTGKNYAWDGSVWDDLGGLVDLSNYVDLTSEQTVSGHKIFSSLAGISAEKYSGMDYSSLTLNGDEGVYVTTGNSYRFVNIQGNLEPSANDIFDIGTSGSAWKDLYLSGRIHLRNDEYTYIDGSNGTIYMTSTNGDIRCGAFFIPNVGNAYDLGSSTYDWKNLYLSGKAYFKDGTGNSAVIWTAETNEYGGLVFNRSGSSRLGFGNTDVRFYSVSLLPAENNINYSIGSVTAKWKDLYLSGNLSNGTDTATVADIAALIAYAKAQGWIS